MNPRSAQIIVPGKGERLTKTNRMRDDRIDIVKTLRRAAAATLQVCHEYIQRQILRGGV